MLKREIVLNKCAPQNRSATSKSWIEAIEEVKKSYYGTTELEKKALMKKEKNKNEKNTEMFVWLEGTEDLVLTGGNREFFGVTPDLDDHRYKSKEEALKLLEKEAVEDYLDEYSDDGAETPPLYLVKVTVEKIGLAKVTKKTQMITKFTDFQKEKQEVKKNSKEGKPKGNVSDSIDLIDI